MILFNHFVVVDFVDRPRPAFHAGLFTLDPFGIWHYAYSCDGLQKEVLTKLRMNQLQCGSSVSPLVAQNPCHCESL